MKKLPVLLFSLLVVSNVFAAELYDLFVSTTNEISHAEGEIQAMQAKIGHSSGGHLEKARELLEQAKHEFDAGSGYYRDHAGKR
ncbi:hypothetical protein [Glaciimonas soli]|uniref:Uncharacterized protein n=1 Tax=Glaciimonas soli TaxID=2590999 RepID=A0A843YXS0_9BURK|nr:hypothetical protein [Glaciimonas soli]MQR02797.1 hypothetical protein [Glaciimonas soli]